MSRRMWWAIGTVAALAVLSTTQQDRLQAKQRLARWNPLFYALFAVGLISLMLMILGG